MVKAICGKEEVRRLTDGVDGPVEMRVGKVVVVVEVMMVVM